MMKENILTKSKVIDSLEAANGYSLNLGDYMRKPRKIGIKVLDKSDKDQTEIQVVTECTKYLRKNGWITKLLYTGGIPLSGGGRAPNPCKGIPDSIAFHPATNRLIWIEYKRSKGGLVSEEQVQWHKLLDVCGQEIYVINSLKLLEEVLEK